MATKRNLFIFGLVAMLLCPALVEAQCPPSDARVSPCTDVNGVRGTCEESTRGTEYIVPAAVPVNSEVRFSVLDNPLTICQGGRYKANWIFGDGEFIFNDDEVSDPRADLSTLAPIYKYSRASTYSYKAVMIEKKSNREPPNSARTRGKIQVVPVSDEDVINSDTINKDGGKSDVSDGPIRSNRQVSVAPPPIGTTRINGSNNRVAIDKTNTITIKGYETAFAVSAPPKEGSVVFFLYNSLKNDSTGGKYLPEEFLFDDEGNTMQPDYNNRPVVKGGVSGSGLNRIIGSTNISQYRNFIATDIMINSSVVPNMNIAEYRFFPIIKTKSCSTRAQICTTGSTFLDKAGGIGMARFMVLVLENARIATNGGLEPINPQGNYPFTNLTPEQRIALKALIIEALGNSISIIDSTLEVLRPDGSPSGMRIRGIKVIEVPIKAVIDPTELEILEICPVEGQNDLYKLRMQMSVCNEGNLPARNVSFALVTAGQTFTGVELVTGGDKDKFEINDQLGIDTLLRGEFNKEIPGARNPETGVEQDNCFELFINAQTNWAGVQALQIRKGIIARVTFPEALVQTIDFPNNSIDSTKVTQKHGFNCGDPDPLGGCIWWLVILFALALAFWWWWTKQNEN
jgi:hypothetical protein